MMVSIQSTAQPTEKLPINEWFKFIHNQGKKPKENTIKDGGLWHSEKTDLFLKECKLILESEK